MIELLNKKHNRTDFDCGNDLLNHYLQSQAGQDIKRKLSACFVLANDRTTIQGFYTLSNNSIPLNLLPEAIRKRLPESYAAIPATLLGRLAIDINHQGKGLGEILLIDALQRSYEASQQIASFAVIVDPIDKQAEDFYKKYDFLKLPDSGKMFIAIKTLQHLFS